MLSPQTLFRGITSRFLPAANLDSVQADVAVRFGRYGEAYGLYPMRKQHLIADEGGYFVTNTAQSSFSGPTVTSFTAASPAYIIANTDSPDNPNAKRIYLDYITQTVGNAGVAASAGASLQCAMVLDLATRFNPAGGTSLTPNIVNVNMDTGNQSIANVIGGQPAAGTATPSARTIIGQRAYRVAVSAAVTNVVGETYNFIFGSVEAVSFSQGVISGGFVANETFRQTALPPVIIGPGQCGLFYTWQMNGTSIGGYFSELGWWER